MKSKSFFLLIILLPAIEIFLFVEIGSILGSIGTIIFTILTATIGLYLLRNGAFNELSNIQSKALQGFSVGDNIISAVSSTISGILLIIPGFFTDFTGLVLFIKPVRNWIISNILPINNHQKGNHRRKNVIDIDKDDSEWDIFVIWLLKFM